MTTDIERAAFEEWARNNGFRLDWIPSRQGYENGLTDCAWKGWEARASRPVVVTDEMVEAGARAIDDTDVSGVGWNNLRDSFKREYRSTARAVLSAALNGGTDA